MSEVVGNPEDNFLTTWQIFCLVQVKAVRVKSKKMSIIFETRREKTGFLHMRKQRRRSASR